SANLPVILYTVYWKRFNTSGAVTAILSGLLSALYLYPSARMFFLQRQEKHYLLEIHYFQLKIQLLYLRSEERRVGKEISTGWSVEVYEKKILIDEMIKIDEEVQKKE